ncbi:MAG: hypothetical protein H0X63_08090, partial [Flavobacteriales bacterium]|nr:hypothetical protein [Flavobacteriales bacterium]
PAAFYGLFALHSKLHYLNNGTINNASGSQAIFDTILIKFINRNKTYIDIRNENNLSYNFYENYGNGEVLLNLDNTAANNKKRDNVALDINNATAKNYYTSDWPLLILENSDFTLDSNATKSSIRMCLWNGANPILRKVFFTSGAKYYYHNDKKRGNKPHTLREKNRFEDIGRVDDWTNDVVLSSLVITYNSNKKTIASFFKLLYIREYGNSQQGLHIPTANNWDNIFIIKPQLNSKFFNNNLTNWNLSGHQKYVYSQNDNFQYYNGLSLSGLAIDKDPVTFNNDRITFYYINRFIEDSSIKIPSSINNSGTGGNSQSVGSFFELKESSVLEDGSGKLKITKISEVKDSQQHTSNDKLFLQYIEKHTLKKNNRKTNFKESINAFSFKINEYDTIKNLAQSNFEFDRHPVFVQVETKEINRENNDPNYWAYQTLKLKLVGYGSNGAYHEISVPDDLNTNGVTLYSLLNDGKIFCTQEAAQFEPVQLHENSNINIFDDSEIVNSDDTINYLATIENIKKYNLSLYARLQIIGIYGVPVYFHDKPGEKQYKKFKIKVIFNNDPNFFDPNEIGRMEVSHYYHADFDFFQNMPSDHATFRLKDLFIDTNLPQGFDNRYKYVNTTRLIDLHVQKNLTSSQINDYLFLDYSEEEIIDGILDPSKIYVESIMLLSGSFTSGQTFERSTINKLKQLGIGTADPENSILVHINRAEIYNLPEYFERPILGSNPILVKGPRIKRLGEVLVHEIAHAESAIKDPTMYLLWNEFESFFDNHLDQNGLQNVVIIDPPSSNQYNLYHFNKIKINPNYPNPNEISSSLTSQQNTDLLSEGFLAKTGPGHLRGNPNALISCTEERIFGEAFKKVSINKIKDIYRKYGYDTHKDIEIDKYAFFDYRYCYLNYNNSKL